jgi:Protein of unknown function (DUF3108)
MPHSRFAIAALWIVAACAGETKPAPDSSAVTTTAANGAVLGDTAIGRRATPTSATAITPAPPSGRPVPSAIPAAPNATAAGTPGQPAPVAAGTDSARNAAPTAAATTAAAQQALAPATPAAPQRAPIPYSAGERLAYDVKFGSIDVGDAVMEVLGLENVRGREALHIRFNVKGGTFVYKVNDRYESWIDTVNLVSLRHWQKIDEGSYERERKYEIMPEIGVYKENEKPNQPTVAEPLDDGSFFFFLRTIPLEVGKTYSFDRYFKPDRNPVTVTVVRRERVKVPAGTFEAIVLHPTIKAKGIFGEGGQAEIWLADDSSRIMLQMKSRLKIGSLNLYLKNIRRGGR